MRVARPVLSASLRNPESGDEPVVGETVAQWEPQEPAGLLRWQFFRCQFFR